MRVIQSVSHCFNLPVFFKGKEELIKRIPYIWGVSLGTKIPVLCGVWAGTAYGPWSLLGHWQGFGAGQVHETPSPLWSDLPTQNFCKGQYLLI